MNLIQRKLKTSNPIAQKIFSIMDEKETNLIVSLDVQNQKRFLEVVEKVGRHIVILKTHIEMIENFNFDFLKKLLALKERYNFLLFEDRKFADIGNTVKAQYTSGIFKIINWAEIVTAHIFPGPSVIEGLREAWQETNYERGVVLIPQMTSRDNLFDERSEQKAIAWAERFSDFVVGFIGACSQRQLIKPQKRDDKDYIYETDETELRYETNLASLREKTWPDFLIFTPGVRKDGVGDSLGQTYVLPHEAVSQGADCIIVGRGIYDAHDPENEASEYKKEAWDALMSRK